MIIQYGIIHQEYLTSHERTVYHRMLCNGYWQQKSCKDDISQDRVQPYLLMRTGNKVL